MTEPIILVTGGTGFAGSHLLEALVAQGRTNLHTTHFGRTVELPFDTAHIQFHQVDLTDKQATFDLIQQVQPDQIYHLASFAAVGKSFEQADGLLKNNIGLQLNMLEAVRQLKPTARLLSIGSAEEYGLVNAANADFTIDESFPFNPINPYAVSKLTQEHLAVAYINSYQLSIIRVRPFNHIGERQSLEFVIPAFISQLVQIEKGQLNAMKVGNLEATRDFTDVKDMVHAYMLLMEKGQVGEVYNVGSGQGWRISDVLHELITLSSAKVTLEQDPNRMRPSDIPRFVANADKIRALGWQPQIALTETLQRVLTEWRNKS
jgi:GDP-4-dehydro-6-deoxy-D-mannose reductase